VLLSAGTKRLMDFMTPGTLLAITTLKILLTKKIPFSNEVIYGNERME
jgi:hypothetical protein